MNKQFGLTQEYTNTRYAPLAALIAYYGAEKVLEPLQGITSASQIGDFSLAEKLEQLIVSILAGCEYISMVNMKLRPEGRLAQVKRIFRFADQSTLSRALDELTQMNRVYSKLVRLHQAACFWETERRVMGVGMIKERPFEPLAAGSGGGGGKSGCGSARA